MLGTERVSNLISSSVVLNRIIMKLDHLHVCAGNPDEHFINLAEQRKGVFFNCSNEPVAAVDGFFPVTLEGIVYNQTIRSKSCEILVDDVKCISCKKYRPTLRSLYSRWSKQQNSDSTDHTMVSSHTNYRYVRKSVLDDLAL